MSFLVFLTDKHTVDFPLEHERRFSYEYKPEIVERFKNCLNDTEIVSFLEHVEYSIIECSFENKTLYRCSKTEEERENELNGLRNNKVYFTYTYLHSREQCHVEKNYGAGAYFLEDISAYVYEHNPYIHKVVYKGTETQRVLELTDHEYIDITVMNLWCMLSRKSMNVSPHMLFSYWLKNVKHVTVLKITGTEYEYPILIFL